MRFTKSLLQSKRIHPVVPAVGQPFTFPAPVGGWNTRDPLAEMEPQDAVVLDNYFPTTGNAQLRGGSMPWATGMAAGPVETLMQWDGGSTQQMWAIANHAIYNVTASGAVGAPAVSGLTNNRWQYTMFSSIPGGSNRLVLVNGIDDMEQYDGAAWHVINAGSAPISITGVLTNTLNNVWQYQRRLFFTQNNSTQIWFLPLNQFGGAAVSFDLGPYLSLGGYIVAGATWTQQGLNGPQDLCVFISSRGQVIIYSGNDPTNASTWQQIGTYNTGAPIGIRCLIPTGADVAIICLDGIVGLSSIITLDRAASNKVALSSKIKGAYNEATNLYPANFGWEAISYPKQSQVFFNIPYQENVQQAQFVLNAITGSWCRYVNLNANTWCLFKEKLYFGNNAGQVWLADVGDNDNNQPIPGTWVTAYNYIGNPGFHKNVKMIRPNIYSDPSLAYGIGVSFNLNQAPPLPNINSPPSLSGQAIWNVATWDVSSWSASTNINNWATVGGSGTSVSAVFTTSTAGYSITISSVDIWFEQGGPIKMLKLLFAKKDDDSFKITLAKWVTQRVFMIRKLRPEDLEVIAVARTSSHKSPTIIAALLYHDYAQMGDGGKIEISMAAEDPIWAQKGIIRALLHYPFIQLRCHVVICTTNRTNERTRKFLRGIGFQERGTVPNRPYADDTVIYALRIEEAIKRGWVVAPQQEKAA